MTDFDDSICLFWQAAANDFQRTHTIDSKRFHLGPLLPGAQKLSLLSEDFLAKIEGLNCLELGCGAGQNSRFLASRGAACCGVDISPGMLTFARRANSDIDWRCADFQLIDFEDESFDFIHSVLAFPFLKDQASMIQRIANWLKPGGSFLLSTNHPAFCGEWIELEDFAEGMFSTSYLRPPQEMRFAQNEEIAAPVFTYPPSDYFSWFKQAGLQVECFLEPRAVEIGDFCKDSLCQATPYMTPLWKELYPRMQHFPLAQVYLVRKPA